METVESNHNTDKKEQQNELEIDREKKEQSEEKEKQKKDEDSMNEINKKMEEQEKDMEEQQAEEKKEEQVKEQVEEVIDEDSINIMKIFKKFKCSRIILSYLRLSHIVSLSFLSKSLYKTVNKYYGDCIVLDLSEYYGVIGSPEFDHQSFMNDFLPKFKSVQSLSLRYCSHLKVVHLDNIIKALTANKKLSNKTNNMKKDAYETNKSSDNNKSNKSSDNNNNTNESIDQIKNEQIKSLNLYFCSRLGSRALWKISSRLVNLEYLNLARCYAITADKNINGLKLLGSLPLKTLAISLDPSIQKAEAIDVYSLLIDEDSFRSLKTLDLSHGCEILHEIEDLSDLTQIRKIQIIKPIKHNK